MHPSLGVVLLHVDVRLGPRWRFAEWVGAVDDHVGLAFDVLEYFHCKFVVRERSVD